jgi:hypothetical protein
MHNKKKLETRRLHAFIKILALYKSQDFENS